MLKGFRGIRVEGGGGGGSGKGRGLGDQEFLERLVGSDGNPREFVRQLRKSVAA